MLRRWARRLLLLLFSGLILAWLVGSLIARPSSHPVAPPESPGRVVHLTASDGVHIEGSYWPGSRTDAPAVLLLHGINNDRNIFRQQSRWLNEIGYAVLAIDFRGHGQSGRATRSFGLHEARDAAAALAFLRSGAPRRKVGVIGVSLGGAAALLGENGPLQVEAMVLHAVYPDIRTAIANRISRVAFAPVASLLEPLLSYQAQWRYGTSPDRIAPVQAIKAYRGSLLVIGGTEDRDTTVEDTEALYRAAGIARKSLWIVRGADHVDTSKLWTEEYRRRIRALFERELGQGGDAILE